MAAELLSLIDAAELLGVSVERVRQLVLSGQLPGKRFGNAWAVPRDAVVARRHAPSGRGRPLSPARAWQEILANNIDPSQAGRFRRRSSVVRGAMSRSDVEALPRLVGALHGGVRAAVLAGELLKSAETEDVYLSQSSFDRIPSLVAFVPDVMGTVSLHVVDDDVWPLVGSLASLPIGAVTLDLLNSDDPRHWISAESLLSKHAS